MLNSLPLSNPEVFAAALEQVAQIFPPASYNFVLITKSHGNRTFAIVPRIVVRHEYSSRDEVLAVASASDNEELHNLPSWVNSIGIRKSEYFSIIERAGVNLGMRFSLVYLEACKSRESLHGDIHLPDNVTRLIAPSGKLEFQNVDFRWVLSGTDSVSENLFQFLSKKFPKDVAVRLPVGLTRRIVRIAPYYIPLILLCAFFLVFYRIRRNTRGVTK